ncbi:MAG: hypothetical protein QM831_39705 [Kofleriaceae bacterium]
MKLVLLALVAGCLDPEPELATTDQALNGETWTTVDAPESEEMISIAISPTTHTVLSLGTTATFSIYNEPITRISHDGKTFKQSHTFPGYGYPVAITADDLGYFYVVVNDQDFTGFHVYRSIDDGASWNQARAFTGEVARGVSVDGSNLFVSGNGAIWRGANRGNLWSTSLDAGDAYVQTTCNGRYDGKPATFAIGASAGSELVWVSLDDGATWKVTHIADDGPAGQEPVACSTTPAGYLAIATEYADKSLWDAKVWAVGLNRLVASESFSGANHSALGVVATPNYVYFTGAVGSSWSTQRLSISDGTITAVDQFTAQSGYASLAYDPTRGLYAAVGTSVRHRQ